MAVVQIELRSAILAMRYKKTCLGSDRPPLIEAKCATGILMNGMSRFRGLRHAEKLKLVLKGQSGDDCDTLRNVRLDDFGHL